MHCSEVTYYKKRKKKATVFKKMYKKGENGEKKLGKEKRKQGKGKERKEKEKGKEGKKISSKYVQI